MAKFHLAWKQAFLLFCAVLLPAISHANLLLWEAGTTRLRPVDANQNSPGAALDFHAPILSVDTDSLDRAWVLTDRSLIHVSAAGNQDAVVELASLGLGSERRLRVDPYDGTVWLGDNERLIHIGLDGASRERLLAPESIVDFAVGLDQTLWILGTRTARQFDFRSSESGQLVHSVAVDRFEPLPDHILPDPLNRAVWLFDRNAIRRVPLDGVGDVLRIDMLPKTVSIALDGKSGSLWVLTEQELVELDRGGQRRSTIQLAKLPIKDPTALVLQPEQDSAWIAHSAGITQIGFDGRNARLSRFPKDTNTWRLAGPALSVSPKVRLVGPEPASAVVVGSVITLGMSANCGVLACDLPPSYYEGFRIDSRLGAKDLTFSIDPDTRIAWHKLSTLPGEGGHLDFSAQAVDEFGHSSDSIRTRYLAPILTPAVGSSSSPPTQSVASAASESAVPNNAASSPSPAEPAATQGVAAQADPQLSRSGASDMLRRLPMAFEANRGQHHQAARFVARASGFGLFLANDEAVISLRRRTPTPSAGTSAQSDSPKTRFESPSTNSAGAGAATTDVLRKRFPGAMAAQDVQGEGPLASKTNYLVGPDPAKWHTDVPQFSRVRYRSVYPGIDQVYYGVDGRLEYDWVVNPGADPLVIRERFDGARNLSINAQGDLVIDLKHGQILQHKPVVYQLRSGSKDAVAGQYVLHGATEVGFQVGTYDKTLPLVIDPVIGYATYLGGTNTDSILGAAIDAAGNIFVVGATASYDFPADGILSGPQPAMDRGNFGFVTKLNAAGTSAVYSTFIGGLSVGYTYASAIAVDSSGNAYVGVNTESETMPTSAGAFQDLKPGRQLGSSSSKGYVCKVNPDGNALLYGTYLGGQALYSLDAINAIAIDSSGNAYVAGSTQSADFPVTPGAYLTTKPSATTSTSSSAFVSKLNPSGTALVYSTFLGGTGDTWDRAMTIAADDAGNAFVGGLAQSLDFPTTPGALRTARAGGSDGFITQINPSGTGLVWSTLLGGGLPTGSTSYSGVEAVQGIALDGQGNLYAAGYTNSTDFPIVSAYQPTMKGRVISSTTYGTWRTTNAFLTKINLSNKQLVYSTYLGGGRCQMCPSQRKPLQHDVALAVSANAAGTATIAGYMLSDDFPIVGAAVPAGINESFDPSASAFVAQFDSSGALKYSFPVTTRGLNRNGSATGVATDASGNAYVAGAVGYGAIATTAGVIQRVPGEPVPSDPAYSMHSDGFVVKVVPDGQITVGLGTDRNPSTAGQNLKLTVNISGGLPGTSGAVSWCDGDLCTSIGTSPSGSIVQVSVVLASGTHNLTARYSDGINPPLTSPVLVQTVSDPVSPDTAPDSTTVLTTTTSNVVAGQSATVNATIATSATFWCVPNGGAIDLLDSGVPIATSFIGATTATSVTYTFSPKWTTPGTHYLIARYSGSACAKSSTSGPITITVDDFAPLVSIASPANNARFESGSTITLAAVAGSPVDRPIARVRFFASFAGGSGNQIGVDLTTPPYTTTWSASLGGTTGGVPTGTYSVYAVAVDGSGNSAKSSPITIEVAPRSALGETITYLHNDVTGNPVMATDEAGAVLWKESYKPYGERLRNETAAGSNRQFFHGKAYDSESGLQYFGARYYDPVIGRFMGVDPQQVDEANLHSFNRYAYGNNNPYKYLDPDGRFPVLGLVIGIGSWFGIEVFGPNPVGPAHAPDAINPTTFPDASAALKGVGAAVGVIGSLERQAANSAAVGAAGSLPAMKGMGAAERATALSEAGFSQTRVSSSAARNETWRHADGSEVRVHPYGGQNASQHKSGNNAHLHKQDAAGSQLNDRGIRSSDPNATHIGLPNPADFPTVRGRPHGD